jgi:hypothetical protein
MNYIAHNPSETLMFISGLQKWKTKDNPNLCDPITAAQNENWNDAKGEIHMVCYRAVHTLMGKNKLKCFEKVDYAGVVEKKALLDLKGIFSNNCA